MTKKILVLTSCALLLGIVACQNKKPPEAPVFTPAPSKDLSTIYYDYDESVVRTDQTDALISNGQVIKDHSMRVTIEGHCDERGTNEYNMALGDRRAQSAKNYLINLGVDPSSMDTISYGEERPACMEHDESCWWRNRRAEFKK